MEKILYIFIHLVLPLLLIIDFALRRPKSSVGLITRAVLYVSIIYFLYLWGQWPLVGSYYFRYIMLSLIIMLLIMAVLRYRSQKMIRPNGIFKIISIGIKSLISLFIFILIIIAFLGKSYPIEAIELEFPLKGGEYYIASGGSNKIINNHIRDYPTSQQYALDINKLGKYKGVSTKMLSIENTDHHIFGETVHCPCEGLILETKTNVKDNLGSSMEVSSEDGTGNFVHVKCDSIYIFIPHFKQHSIIVSQGMEVKEGSPLGQVGISGFAQEPHLHFQAAVYNSDSILVGVPIKFKGKTLSRNNLYKSP